MCTATAEYNFAHNAITTNCQHTFLFDLIDSVNTFFMSNCTTRDHYVTIHKVVLILANKMGLKVFCEN